MTVRRIRIAELLASPAEIESLAGVLARGGVVAIPTETFYGLAVDPRSEEGVRRVLALKRRGAAKPLLVLFGARSHLAPLGVAASEETFDRFFGMWPAPLTVVFPLSAPLPASRDALTLALRLPAHAALRALLTRVGPVTGTSLNRSGDPPCCNPDEAARLLRGELDLLIDGGDTPGGLPSTLVDATVDPPRVVREGAYPWPAPRS